MDLDFRHGTSGVFIQFEPELSDQRLLFCDRHPFVVAMLILAGGLNCENAEEAVKQKTFGLDFNSGLESAPGCKDLHKIKELFKILRNY